MDTLKIFLSTFWPAFFGALIASLGVWILRRFHYDSFPLPSLNPKGFAELAGYSKEEQKRVLDEASTKAFRHWRGFFPAYAFVFVTATGIAVAHTLPKVTTIPKSPWLSLAVVTVFIVCGGWLTRFLTTRYVRPFLRACIERSHEASFPGTKAPKPVEERVESPG